MLRYVRLRVVGGNATKEGRKIIIKPGSLPGTICFRNPVRFVEYGVASLEYNEETSRSTAGAITGAAVGGILTMGFLGAAIGGLIGGRKRHKQTALLTLSTGQQLELACSTRDFEKLKSLASTT